jgi:membrane protease YdiL (CAAX protease family)
VYAFATLALVPVLQASSESPDSGLTAFVGLTGLVITGFLVLARLSQRVVDDADAGVSADAAPSRTPTDRAADSAGRVGDDTAERPGDETAGHAGDDPEEHREGDASRRRVGAFGGAVAPAPTDPDARRTDGEADPSDSSGADGDAGGVGAGADGAGAGTDDAVGDVNWADGTAEDRLPAGSADRVSPDPAAQLSPGALLANVALTQGLFGVVLVGGAVYFGVPGDALGLAATEISTGPTALAVGVGLGVVLWVGNELATGVADAAGAGYDEGLREVLAPASAGGWALLLGVTLPVIAVVEESIFRAAAVGATTTAFSTSPWALAIVSSVAFALGHGAQGRVGVAVTGGLGFALAAGFVLTNSLLVVVVAHYLVNALEFVVHEWLGAPDPVWN